MVNLIPVTSRTGERRNVNETAAVGRARESAVWTTVMNCGVCAPTGRHLWYRHLSNELLVCRRTSSGSSLPASFRRPASFPVALSSEEASDSPRFCLGVLEKYAVLQNTFYYLNIYLISFQVQQLTVMINLNIKKNTFTRYIESMGKRPKRTQMAYR